MKLWLTFMVIALLPACGRRNSELNQPRIKTVYNSTGGCGLTYYYSAAGKLDSVVTSKGNKTIYKRHGNILSTKTVTPSGMLVDSGISYLNGRNLADSMVSMDESRIAFTKKIEYDDNGFAILEKRYESGRLAGITTKVINGGNITSFSVIDCAPFPYSIKYNPVSRKKDTVFINVSSKEYTVYLDYLPGKTKTLTCLNYGCPEYGTGSKNVEKSTVQISAQGDTIDATSYNYTFDSRCRVSFCVTRSLSGKYDSTAVTYY